MSDVECEPVAGIGVQAKRNVGVVAWLVHRCAVDGEEVSGGAVVMTGCVEALRGNSWTV